MELLGTAFYQLAVLQSSLQQAGLNPWSQVGLADCVVYGCAILKAAWRSQLLMPKMKLLLCSATGCSCSTSRCSQEPNSGHVAQTINIRCTCVREPIRGAEQAVRHRCLLQLMAQQMKQISAAA